jgi:hypothetical protein
VIIRLKIRKAITPDSHDTFPPSQTGLTKKRRMKRPAMETATQTAKAAAK